MVPGFEKKTLSSPGATLWPQREGGGRERAANATPKCCSRLHSMAGADHELGSNVFIKISSNLRWGNENDVQNISVEIIFTLLQFWS